MKQTKFYSSYKKLLREYGHPVELWPQWCAKDKDESLRQLIAIGAILVQRTSWANAERAIYNLKKANLLSIDRLGDIDLEKLTGLIRVAGFYTTKPKRLKSLCQFIQQIYGSITQMKDAEMSNLRKKLLEVYGVGPETADVILLYALDKPSLVIDEYAKRFVQKYGLTKETGYVELKQLFERSLPQNVEVYQNYHVLMIADAKGKEHCRMTKI